MPLKFLSKNYGKRLASLKSADGLGLMAFGASLWTPRFVPSRHQMLVTPLVS